jgi:hypothetical protein
MSFYTLLYVRSNSKPKKSPHPLRHSFVLSWPNPLVSQNKEACHAL